VKALLNDVKYKSAALAWQQELKSEHGKAGTAATICDRICAAV
jgi:hypothetical protein